MIDETVGGFVIWVPGSMMCLIAAIIVLHLWGKDEERSEEKRLARRDTSAPTTGAALVAQAAPKNKAMALGVLGFTLAMFVSAFLIGLIDHIETHAREQAELTHTARP